MPSADDLYEYRLIQGDAKAFECLFKLFYPKLILFSNRFLNDMKASEEIVSDVFTVLWEKGHEIAFTGTIKSYLFKSVQNRCYNYIKRQKIQSFYIGFLERNNLLHEAFYMEESALQEKETSQQIALAIEALPEKCRQVFKLSRYQHLKYKEISCKLNISEKTVERHMGIALEKLRRFLKNVTYLL